MVVSFPLAVYPVLGCWVTWSCQALFCTMVALTSTCTSCASSILRGLLKIVIVMIVQGVFLMLSDIKPLHAVSPFFPLWEIVYLGCILIYKPLVYLWLGGDPCKGCWVSALWGYTPLLSAHRALIWLTLSWLHKVFSFTMVPPACVFWVLSSKS